jgi:hypothetical protein
MFRDYAIDAPDAKPQPGTAWQEVQAFELSIEEPLPAATDVRVHQRQAVPRRG